MKNPPKEQIREFVQYYEEIGNLNKELTDLTVDDVYVQTYNGVKILVPKGLETMKKYKEFDSTIKKIEKKISKL